MKELEKELERKVQQKEALIKEAKTDYQAARANGRSWKVRNTLRAVQGLVLVAHVCKVGASAPIMKAIRVSLKEVQAKAGGD